jgi:hypothetical protein
VLARNLEPGVPEGNAWVYAVGASLDVTRLTLDLAYSVRDHRVREETPWTRYSATAHLFGVSVTCRF